jgi:hypothetical protein
VFWRIARLEKRLDLGSATRNATPHSAKHRVAWALQTAKGTGQKCEKSWENQGFLAERTGFEQPAKSLGTARFSTPRDAKYDARRKHTQDDSKRYRYEPSYSQITVYSLIHTLLGHLLGHE